LQLDKTDDFFRHVFLLTGDNALALGLGFPGVNDSFLKLDAESGSGKSFA
jgi:hypothetical protein